ncbi:hypothetical protein BK133_00910 [Paenibacillus sp. FSL H8-0548]|nr:hypothetical protein BK133_00910 [Paenibacillus sp. FSL H8-0548]
MHWERIPLIKAITVIVDSIKRASYTIFVRFPLTSVGFKWCLSCKEKVSPKQTLVIEIIHSFAGDLPLHFCQSCGEKSAGRDI